MFAIVLHYDLVRLQNLVASGARYGFVDSRAAWGDDTIGPLIIPSTFTHVGVAAGCAAQAWAARAKANVAE
jgi:hypothetical protein